MRVGTDYNLTGQDVLVSLYNLFTDLNHPKSQKNLLTEVCRWSVDNLHPYDIDLLYDLATELEPGTSTSTMLQTDARFELSTFLHDLCNLGNTFAYYMALRNIKENGKTTAARALYYEGRICDGLPFFEKYRGLENDQEYIAKVIENYDEHLIGLIGMFPDFRMRLKRDKMTKKIMYGADVQSVFDIAWYAFSRMVADVAPPADEDLDYEYSQGAVLSCLACGRAFVRHSSRQRYCGSPDCEAERNRKNRRASYARAKEKAVENGIKKKKSSAKPKRFDETQ